MSEAETFNDWAGKLLTEWVEGKTLPPHLRGEMDHYLYGIDDREYEVTIGEGMMEWLDRHDDDRNSGWLRPADVSFIRAGLIEKGIVVPHDPDAVVIMSHPRSRIAFRHKGVAYEWNSRWNNW